MAISQAPETPKADVTARNDGDSAVTTHARRCGLLLLDPRETAEFDIDSLFHGGSGLRMSLRWVALAPHLGVEHDVDATEREILGRLDSVQWIPIAALHARFGAAPVDRLLALGLLIGDGPECAELRTRDDRLRTTHWHVLSAASHAFGRWSDVDSSDALEQTGLRSLRDLVEKLGPPPGHLLARCAPQARIALERAGDSSLMHIMQRRTTCRNFDSARPLPATLLAAALQRVFFAQAVHAISDGTAVVKKTSPSGGGLHPTECYVLVQSVTDITPGLYHYHAGDHALEPLPLADGSDLAALAHRFVAGQTWFANAHAMLILAPRFDRSFWKYRNHAKAYRALILDVGHLSQTLYLVATELGLGAYVTAAINEREIETVLGLDGMHEGPLAVCGIGWRSGVRDTVEFDPLRQVWPD